MDDRCKPRRLHVRNESSSHPLTFIYTYPPPPTGNALLSAEILGRPRAHSSLAETPKSIYQSRRARDGNKFPNSSKAAPNLRTPTQTLSNINFRFTISRAGLDFRRKSLETASFAGSALRSQPESSGERRCEARKRNSFFRNMCAPMRYEIFPYHIS